MNKKVVCKFKHTHLQGCLRRRNKTSILVRQYEHLGKLILTEKPSKYNGKDATTIRKHYYQNNHQGDSYCFTLTGDASNNFHLKLKEPLLILKLKPSLNVAKEFDNDAYTLVNTQFMLP